MSEHKELNDTQLLWANEYLSNGFNKTAASKVAYPDAERHREIGYENYTKPHIKAYIQKRVTELLQGKGELTKKWIDRTTEIAFYENEGLPEDAKYKGAEILKALDLLGKYLSLFVEKKEIEINDVSERKLTREEMIAKLKESEIGLDPIGS